jgi:hypothetical protein
MQGVASMPYFWRKIGSRVQLVVGMAVLSFPPEILLCCCVANCVCWVVAEARHGEMKMTCVFVESCKREI